MPFARAEVRKRHLHDAGETVPSLAAGRRKISQLSLKRSGGRGPWAIGNTSKRVHLFCGRIFSDGGPLNYITDCGRSLAALQKLN